MNNKSKHIKGIYSMSAAIHTLRWLTLILISLFSTVASANPYLQNTMEIDVNAPELVSLVESLDNNPVNIYNWVYNNIRHEQYAGARKNALSVYWTKAGNSWGHSTLLINLYRIAGIEARYVFPNAAALSASKIAEYQTELTEGQASGSISQEMTLERYIESKVTNSDTVYVEAKISMKQARGIGSSTPQWVQLAPWKKAYTYSANGINFFDANNQFIYDNEVDFDLDDYVSEVRQESAWEMYKKQLSAALNEQGNSLKKSAKTRFLLKRTGSVLPLSLPLDITTQYPYLSANAAVPEVQKLKVTILLTEVGSGRALLNHDVYLSQIATSRLTIDFTTSSSYNGLLTESSSLAVNPVLKLDDTVLTTGAATNTNQRYQYSYQVSGEDRKNRLTRDVGSMEILTFDYLNVSHEYIAKLKEELNNTDLSTLDDWRTRGEYLSRYLQILSSQYLLRYKDDSEEIDALLNLASVMSKRGTFSINMYSDPKASDSNYENIDESLQQKYLIHPAINIDAQIIGINQYNIFSGKFLPFDNIFRTVYMYSASYQEGLIFEDWQSTSSGSTIHALMRASEDPNNSLVKTITNGVTSIKPASTVEYEGLTIDAEVTLSDNSMSFTYNSNNGGSTTVLVTARNGTSRFFRVSGSHDVYRIRSFLRSNTWDYNTQTYTPAIPYAPSNTYSSQSWSDGDPVDVFTGEFYQEEETDIRLPSYEDLDFSVTRTYRSRSDYNGNFGYGWTWNHMERLIISPDSNDIFYYSNEGKGTRITDNGNNQYDYAKGITFSLSKQGSEYIIQEKDGFKRVFDNDGLLIRKENRLGQTLQFSYDSNYNITRIYDDHGRELTLTYNSNDKTTSVSSSSGQTVNYSYYSNGDANGTENDLKAFTDLEGEDTGYEYIVNSDDDLNNHNLKKYILPESDQDYLEIHYYKNDQVSHHTNSQGDRFDFQYSVKNQYTETWNEKGYYRKVFFNDDGDVVRIDTKDKTLEVRTYDDEHNMLSETDGNGNKTEYTYDDQRNILIMSDPLGHTTTYTYTDNDADGQPMVARQQASISYADGEQELFGYYNNGRLKQKTEVNDSVIDYIYDSYGNLLSETWNKSEPDHYRQNTYAYDDIGLLRTEETIDGKTTQYEHDLQGSVIVRVDPEGYRTEWSFNGFQQPLTQTDAELGVTQYSYNKNRQLIGTTHPNGASVTQTYYAARDIVTKGMLESRTDALGNAEYFQYDPVGNLIASTDKNGNTRRFEYNELKKVILETTPEGLTTHSKYDGVGNIIEQKTTTLLNGESVTLYQFYSYDKRNQLTQHRHSNTTFTENNRFVNYVYDNRGRRTTESHFIHDKTTNTNDISRIVEYEYTFNQLSKQTQKSVYKTPENTLSLFQVVEEQYTYDKLNRRISYTNPNGAVTNYAYDGSSNNISEEITAFDDKQIALQYTYTLRDRLASLTDANGHTQSSTYDGLGRKITDTNALGDTTSYQYDAVGNLLRQISSLRYSEVYEYDLLNQLIHYTNKNGYSTKTRYDANGNVSQQTDENGFATYLYYDEANRLIAQYDDNNRERHYSYDTLGNRTSSTDTLGVLTTYRYDAAANRIRQTLHTAANGEVILEERSYDAAQRLTSLTDANNNITTFTYGDFTQPYQVTDAKGEVTTYRYTKLGDLNVTVRPDNIRNVVLYDKIGRETQTINDFDNSATRSFVQYNYDDAGNIVKEYAQYGQSRYIITEKTWSPLNQLISSTVDRTTTTLAYDADARRMSSTDGNGNTVSYTYDGVGNQLSVTDGRGNSTRYRYDKRNNLVHSQTENDVIIAREYDVYDNLIRTVQNNREARYTYDAKDQQLSMLDFNGNLSTYVYDEQGNRTAQTAAVGSSDEARTRFVYDNNFNLLQVYTPTAGSTASVTYTYDPLDQRLSESTAEGRLTTYTYDALSNMLTRTKPDGTVVEYAYDAQDRQTSVTVDGVVEQNFTYDQLSRLATAEDHNGGRQTHTTSYQYNGLSQLIKETQDGKTVATAYDTAQNPISIDYNGGYQVQQAWDQANNLSNLRYNTYDIASWQYNTDNLVTQVDLYNGIDQQQYYDASARETHRSYGTLLSQSTEYDNNSNILQEKIQLNNQQLLNTYAYDAHDRVTRDNSSHRQTASVLNDHYFSYDLSGNLTGTNHNGIIENRSVNGDNQYTAIIGDQTLTIVYDANGNITQHIDSTYVYDYADRLIEVSRNGQVVASYTYDAENRRIGKTANGTATMYLYRENQVIQEYVGSNTEASISYLYGDDLDNPMAFIKDEQRYFYLKDRRRSIRAITDEQGNIVETYEYSAYGNITIKDAAGNTLSDSAYGNPYTYTGRRLDKETGLYYYRNRMYSANLGRFLSEDPLSYVDGYNLYRYARNNPLRYIDPLGTTSRSTAGSSATNRFVYTPSTTNTSAWGTGSTGSSSSNSTSPYNQSTGNAVADFYRSRGSFWGNILGGDSSRSTSSSSSSNATFGSTFFPNITNYNSRGTSGSTGSNLVGAGKALGNAGIDILNLLNSRSHMERSRAIRGLPPGPSIPRIPIASNQLGGAAAFEGASFFAFPARTGVTGTATRSSRTFVSNTTEALAPRFRQGASDRLESAFAKIEPHHIGTGTETNAATRLFARTLGNSTDDAGHAIARNLGGSGRDITNIFPQAPSVNRGAFRQFEQQIARQVQAGKEIFVRVAPKFESSVATRPNQIVYQVRIDGKTITRVFDNP